MNVECDRIFRVFRNVNDHSAALERTIGVVSARNVTVVKGKTRAVVSNGGCGHGGGFCFRSRGHCRNLNRVRTCGHARNIGAYIRRIGADERIIDQGAVAINVVAGRPADRSPLGVNGFEPAAGLADCESLGGSGKPKGD